MFRSVRFHPVLSEDAGTLLFSIGLIGMVVGLAWLLAEARNLPLPPLA